MGPVSDEWFLQVECLFPREERSLENKKLVHGTVEPMMMS